MKRNRGIDVLYYWETIFHCTGIHFIYGIWEKRFGKPISLFLSYVQELLKSSLHSKSLFALNIIRSTIHAASCSPDVWVPFLQVQVLQARHTKKCFPEDFRYSLYHTKNYKQGPSDKDTHTFFNKFIFFLDLHYAWSLEAWSLMQSSALHMFKGHTGLVIWIFLSILEFRTQACWELSPVNDGGMKLRFGKKFLDIPGARAYIFFVFHEIH